MNNNKGKPVFRPKLVAGIGVNDSATPIQHTKTINGVQKVYNCPYYKKWSLMLERCYKRDYGSFVCTEWLLFSNFKKWCIEQEQEVGDITSLQLDKDLLSIDKLRIYSPDTCCFLPRKVNSFLTTKSKSGLPLGVYPNKKGFSTGYSNPLTKRRYHIGTYATAEEAQEEWIKHKRKVCHELIDAGLIKQDHVKERLRAFY